jgi:hypothetical protein
MRALPRREFLWRALAACSAAGLVPARLARAAQSDRPDRAATSAGYFGDQGDAVRAIGEAYLRQIGRDPTREAALAAARGALEVIDRSRDQAGAIRALVRAVRQDFERGRSLQVEGWILSKTEAELCALTLLADETSSEAPPRAGEPA